MTGKARGKEEEEKIFLFWCNLIVCGISVHVFGPLCVTALSEIVPNV